MKKIGILFLSLLVLCGCQKNEQTRRDIRTGIGYYAAHGEDAICIATVAMENDVIVGVSLDEITYLSNDEFKGLPNTSANTTFGKQTDPTKNLASKVQNDEAYSGLMKANGATHGIKENYKAICDFAVGKSIEDLRGAITNKSDHEIIDAVSGCTLKSTKGYIEAIMEACKNVH